MKIDIKPRGGGKTVEAVEWVKAGRHVCRQGKINGRVLVTATEVERVRILAAFDLSCHEVEAAHNILSGHVHGWRDKELYLDNADIFLHSLFGGLLRSVSLTKWEDSEEAPKFSAKEVRKDRRAMRKVLKKKPGL